MPASTWISTLERFIPAGDADLPPEVAAYFLRWSVSQEDQERVELLSEKANEGTLSPQEQEELTKFIHINDLVSILQAKARMSLRGRAVSA